MFPRNHSYTLTACNCLPTDSMTDSQDQVHRNHCASSPHSAGCKYYCWICGSVHTAFWLSKSMSIRYSFCRFEVWNVLTHSLPIVAHAEANSHHCSKAGKLDCRVSGRQGKGSCARSKLHPTTSGVSFWSQHPTDRHKGN